MDVLFDIISNLVLGILTKLCGIIGRNFSTRKIKKEYIECIKKEIEIKDINIDLKNLKEFLSLTVIKDLIEQYIVCITTAQGVSYNKVEDKRIEMPINKESFINALAQKYNTLFNNNDDDLLTISNAFESILKRCEETAFKLLKSSEKTTLYLMNAYTGTCYNAIEQQFKSLTEKLNCLYEKNIERPNQNYDKIKEKYYQLLKDRYSEAHIYLLDKFAFNSFYVPPTLTYIPQKRNNSAHFLFNFIASNITWEKIFCQNSIVYVIGGAGYGKSLFLKKIINDYKQLMISNPSEYLIIFGELKMFFQKGSDTPISVDQFLKDAIKSNTLLGDEISTEFVQHYLNLGRCIILLDALDEVDKNHRNDLHEKIINFFKNQNPNNKICITSRDRGFIPEKNIEVFHIKPLSHDEIDKYVDNIIKLGKFDKADKSAFMQQTSILIEKGFLNSFLVLSLLLNIFKAERELPENKLDLYSKCFEYITVKREKEKSTERFDWQRISLLMKDNTFMVLSQLGYPNNKDIEKDAIIAKLTNIYKSKYSNENETILAVEEFLRFCSDRTELFVPSNADDKFKFFHRSFFEYFYSLYLFVNYTTPADLIDKFKAFDVDSEVFELTMSMLKQRAESKYQETLSLLISFAEQELKNSSHYNCFNILILVMQIVDDVQYKIQFFQLIIDYKNKICNKLQLFSNLNCLPIILKNFNEYEDKICSAYYKESLMILLQQLSLAIDIYNKSSEMQLTEYSINDLHLDATVESVLRKSPVFYFQLFLDRFDILSELNNIDSKKLSDLNIINRRLIKDLNQFKSMNAEEQTKLVSYITSFINI